MNFVDSYKKAQAGPDAAPAGPGAGDPAAGDAPGALSPAEVAAAHACMTALGSGDAAMFGRALKAFVQAGEPDGDEAAPDEDPAPTSPPIPSR